MTTVYLVRHGESEVNVRRVIMSTIGGAFDLPLTGLGRRQAQLSAAWLEGRGIGRVFAAPALRAQETARIIAERLTVGVTVLEGLDEVRVGDLDGRGDAATWALHAQTLARWFEGELDTAFPGGETFAEALARFERALREIARRYPGGAAAAVTHGAIQITVLPRLCPTMDAGARMLPNVAIWTLEVTPAGFACSLWGSTAHLAGD